ncbi:hypothetical protein SAMN05216338_10815 [Bradyrhizobium sp. Rc2d]|nr:hypothetical protein SAMN05216338_10815 [Bradyrhizobium sp. Rc2d]
MAALTLLFLMSICAESIPFVFATGYGPEVLTDRFRSVRWLEKPVEPSELIREIRQLCGRKRD